MRDNDGSWTGPVPAKMDATQLTAGRIDARHYLGSSGAQIARSIMRLRKGDAAENQDADFLRGINIEPLNETPTR